MKYRGPAPLSQDAPYRHPKKAAGVEPVKGRPARIVVKGADPARAWNPGPRGARKKA